jgi:hypothetical protein
MVLNHPDSRKIHPDFPLMILYHFQYKNFNFWSFWRIWLFWALLGAPGRSWALLGALGCSGLRGAPRCSLAPFRAALLKPPRFQKNPSRFSLMILYHFQYKNFNFCSFWTIWLFGALLNASGRSWALLAHRRSWALRDAAPRCSGALLTHLDAPWRTLKPILTKRRSESPCARATCHFKNTYIFWKHF